MQPDLFAGSAGLAAVVTMVRSMLEDPHLELTLVTPLEDIPGWDSMQQVAVMVDLECRLGITLTPHEVEAVHSVGDIVRVIGARRMLDVA